MATPSAISDQLKQAAKLLADGASVDTSDAMARNIETQISMMSELKFPEATELVHVVSTAGFSPAWRDRLQNAALQRAMLLSNREALSANGTQQLLTPLDWLTLKDWIALEAVMASLNDTTSVLGNALGLVAEIICNRIGGA